MTMGCNKWKLLDIIDAYLLKTVGDPHRAAKLFMNSPRKAALDSWYPHKAAIDLSEIDIHQILKKIIITPSGILEALNWLRSE